VEILDDSKEQGGGSFRYVEVKPFITSSPGVIDVTPHLPRGMSRRNVFIDIRATTAHHVTKAGTWTYRIQLSSQSFHQCGTFDFRSDGISAGSSPQMNRNTVSDAADSPIISTVAQEAGTHELSIRLGCYVLNAEFPTISIVLQAPGDTTGRRPGNGEFTVPNP
jgi:hypothetical protein